MGRNMKKLILLSFLSLSLLINAQEYNLPFYEDGTYDPAVPSPESVLGFNIGDKPIEYGEMVHYISALAEKSARVTLHNDGQTHQGRKLYYMIITSESNFNNLDAIRSGIAKLSDPRKTSDTEAKDIINNSPLIAFMMYSIHGNETSGTDAGIQLAYQLAAGTDEATENLLNNLVVILYPMENPDGRMRFLHQRETWLGKVPNDDTQSMPHSGVWPSGRTNHYFFDLNRDWFILSQPESRARVKIVRDWNPQLVVDAHEMGSFSSFLFNPPREPVNPNMDLRIRNWWKTFASDQAEAMDKYGWSYYTKDWLEEWYPGYGSSYPSYTGAISILYEQARTSGIKVKRPDGVVLTFAEAVHHQFVSSIANLTTAASHKAELLNDFYSIHKDAVSKARLDGVKNFVINPESNEARADKLIDILMFHGIEVYKAENSFSLGSVKNYWNESSEVKFPEGSYIIPAIQPKQKLINAIMEFDTRMTTEFLKSERENLLKGKGTRLYEVSAWSILLAFDVDAYVTKSNVDVDKVKVEQVAKQGGRIINSTPDYGYIIKYEDDNAIKALLRLFEQNVKVRSADMEFKVEGNKYNRGTLLIRKAENAGLDEKMLVKMVEETGVNIIGVNTALSQDGTDLGADRFPLLYEPKIAMFTGTSISTGNFGAMWHLLDNDLKIKLSTINADYFRYYDLRKYNVLIIPSFYGGAAGFKDMLGKGGAKKLNDWISSGGTLIAVGGSAAALADTTLKFSSVKLRSQSLGKLDEYDEALQKEKEIDEVVIDSLAIWEGKITGQPKDDKEKKSKVDVKQLAKDDAFNRRFMPQGVIVKINLNDEQWLSYGLPQRMPALYTSRHILLSRSPVQTAARLADANELRLSGLLWPEAKERMANAAYLTRESKGSGQIILFAEEPNFRSYFEGTERLLLNSILLGPGFGTRQPVEF